MLSNSSQNPLQKVYWILHQAKICLINKFSIYQDALSESDFGEELIYTLNGASLQEEIMN